MTTKRSVLDRLVSLADPKPVAGSFTAPRPVAEGLWTGEGRLRGGPDFTLPVRMTVVRLGDGSLVVHSPLPPEPAIRDGLRALGRVAHVVAPNFVHHLFANEFLDAFPDAAFHLAPGLAERRPELRPGKVLGALSPPEWRGVLDQALYGPVRGLSEVVFLHRPSRTLILADLAFNLRRAETAGERWFWRAAGVWNRFAPSRTIRLTLFRDREAVRRIVRRILEWEFDRIVVAHGDLLETDAKETFRRAFANWLDAPADPLQQQGVVR